MLSQRTMLVVLPWVTLLGLVVVGAWKGDALGVARPMTTTEWVRPSLPGPYLIPPEATSRLDASTGNAGRARELPGGFDPTDPRFLPVLFTVPDQVPPEEHVTVVMSAWKSDGSGRKTRFVPWKQWVEIERVEEVSPVHGLVLRVPRNAERVLVSVEAEYYYLPELVKLKELDNLDPLRLDLKLGGRLHFRLVPQANSELDPRDMVGRKVELLHALAGSYLVGDIPRIVGTVNENCMVKFGGLRPDHSYSLEGSPSPFAPFDLGPARITAGGTAEIEVSLADGLELHGRILDHEGNPTPGGALCVFYADETGEGFLHYDADKGEFHLKGISPGLTQVSATWRGLRSSRVARDGLPLGRVIRGLEFRLQGE